MKKPRARDREKRMKRQLCRIVELVAFQVNRYRRLAFSFTFLFVFGFPSLGRRAKERNRAGEHIFKSLDYYALSFQKFLQVKFN